MPEHLEVRFACVLFHIFLNSHELIFHCKVFSVWINYGSWRFATFISRFFFIRWSCAGWEPSWILSAIRLTPNCTIAARLKRLSYILWILYLLLISNTRSSLILNFRLSPYVPEVRFLYDVLEAYVLLDRSSNSFQTGLDSVGRIFCWFSVC